VWKADPFHTQVEFAAKHLGTMTVRGHFTEISVTGHIDPDHPEATAVEVTIQTASIRTHNETRDNDLRSSNFLGWTSIRRSPSRAPRSSRPGRTATT
jgi:polyisoprenoid-binding protein YceI